MNSVYQQLRSQFTAEESYSGSDVLGAILGAIKVSLLFYCVMLQRYDLYRIKLPVHVCNATIWHPHVKFRY